MSRPGIRLMSIAAGWVIGANSVVADTLVLQNHDIQTGADPQGGRTVSYAPGTNTFFEYYATSQFSYVESEVFGIPGDEQLSVYTTTSGGNGFNGILRYIFSAGQRDETEPFAAALTESPVITFEAQRVGVTSVFVAVNFQMITDAIPLGTGAPSALQAFGVDAGPKQTFAYDLWNDVNFQAYWQSWTNGSGTFFQLRLVQQTDNSNGSAALIAYDNFQLTDDRDYDGIPDVWENLNCGSVTGCVADAQTGDGDDFVYLDEYILDYDPAVSNMPLTLAMDGPTTIVVGSTTNSRLYEAEYIEDLTSGSWSPLASGPGSNGVYTATDPDTATNRHYRVRVRVP